MTKLARTETRNLRGEIWKIIPGTAKKYELSNFGRTRLRGDGNKVIKPRMHFREVSPSGKQPTVAQVEVRVNGQRKMLTISRLVYFLFVEKFDISDRGTVIHYKDGNPHNCAASNLTRVGYAEFVQEGYHNGNRRANNLFVKQAKPVSQYDAEGKLVASYSSAVDASEKTGIPRPYINQAAWLEKHRAGGFYWRYGKPWKRIRI